MVALPVVTQSKRVLVAALMVLMFVGALGVPGSFASANLTGAVLGIPATLSPHAEPVYAPNFLLALRDEVQA